MRRHIEPKTYVTFLKGRVIKSVSLHRDCDGQPCVLINMEDGSYIYVTGNMLNSEDLAQDALHVSVFDKLDKRGVADKDYGPYWSSDYEDEEFLIKTGGEDLTPETRKFWKVKFQSDKEFDALISFYRAERAKANKEK